MANWPNRIDDAQAVMTAWYNRAQALVDVLNARLAANQRVQLLSRDAAGPWHRYQRTFSVSADYEEDWVTESPLLGIDPSVDSKAEMIAAIVTSLEHLVTTVGVAMQPLSDFSCAFQAIAPGDVLVHVTLVVWIAHTQPVLDDDLHRTFACRTTFRWDANTFHRHIEAYSEDGKGTVED